jgi:hypothetical protein
VGLDIAPAKARIKPSGTTMGTELARTKKHLEWAKREKQRALTTQATVKNTFNTTRYNPVAYRTVNTANAEITWAEIIFSFYFSSCFMLNNYFIHLTYFILVPLSCAIEQLLHDL